MQKIVDFNGLLSPKLALVCSHGDKTKTKC
jgi:hypothetical protein